nr:hypothetical protein [Sinorhizobium psoraleae]
MRLIGNPDGNEFSGAQLTGQHLGILAVGLDPIARPARHRRWRYDGTVNPDFPEIAIDDKPQGPDS